MSKQSKQINNASKAITTDLTAQLKRRQRATQMHAAKRRQRSQRLSASQASLQPNSNLLLPPFTFGVAF